RAALAASDARGTSLLAAQSRTNRERSRDARAPTRTPAAKPHADRLGVDVSAGGAGDGADRAGVVNEMTENRTPEPSIGFGFWLVGLAGGSCFRRPVR